MTEDDAVIRLAALANANRLSVFRLLAAAGEDGLLAGDIASQCGMQPSNLSFHLAHLVRAKLIAPDREGRNIRYRLILAETRDTLDFLIGDCCGGHPELCLPTQESCLPATTLRAKRR